MSTKKEVLSTKRISAYSALSTELALLSNKHLSTLLNQARPLGTSIGGTTVLLHIGKTPVFVKKVPLTHLEKQAEHFMSTANLFGLPTYCQYGIGSPGFGVWRELAAHIMSTNWVLSGECPHFPLLYHWRLLPKPKQEVPTLDTLKKLESDVAFWDGSLAVRERLHANLKATDEIVFFLEYIPENLHTWLKEQFAQGESQSEAACIMVESNLKLITSFINSHGLLHFDAHFRNILTDGHCLYLTDFGLALSSKFELAAAELDFFNTHHHYDQCYTTGFLVEWILTELFGAENWFNGKYNVALMEYAAGKGRPLPPAIETIVKSSLPVTRVMDEFHRKLMNETKLIPYPTRQLEQLLK